MAKAANPDKAEKRKAAEELYKKFLTALRAAKIGKVVPHEKGIYARLMDGKRTFGYVVPRGTGSLLVYPNVLAEFVPDGVSFQQVPIDKHHYGRGEVILTVGGDGDFADAVKVLKAAHENPIPKRSRAKAEVPDAPAEETVDETLRQQVAASSEVKPDPKPGTKAGAKAKAEKEGAPA